MQYFDDMQSKWGFEDGELVPAHAEIYRDLYINSVNWLAAKLGSEYRLVAYDRDGVHNWCLILAHEIGAENLPVAISVANDAKLNLAIELVQQLAIDDYLVIPKPTVEQEELDKALLGIVPE